MSLEITGLESGIVGFPRVSGDEPLWSTVLQPLFEFSPREWG